MEPGATTKKINEEAQSRSQSQTQNEMLKYTELIQKKAGKQGKGTKNRWNKKKTNVQYGSLKHNHTDDYIKSKWYDAPEMLILDKK